MRWTTDPPTVPGWYWLKTETGQGMHLVVEIKSGLAILDTWGAVSVDMPGVLWAGPIPEPEEKSKCDHDWRFVQSYGAGWYDWYECAKCGATRMDAAGDEGGEK